MAKGGNVMNKATVRIAYTGRMVDDGTMDIKDLAPALLAFGQMVEDANKAINGDGTKVQVLVRADVQKGSFDIGIDFAYSGFQQIKMMMGAADQNGLTSLLQAIGLVGGAAGGIVSLFEFIKWIKGRKIKGATQLESGNIKIIISNSDYVEIHPNTVKLYRNINVRKNLSEVLKPLNGDGVESFEVRSRTHKKDDQPIISVSHTERDFFEVPKLEAEQELDTISTERDALLKIISVQFEEQYKWRLSDGESSIWATIIDHEFLKMVEDGDISFSCGDMLKVRLRTSQIATTKGIKTENEIIKVIDKISKPCQISLIDD